MRLPKKTQEIQIVYAKKRHNDPIRIWEQSCFRGKKFMHAPKYYTACMHIAHIKIIHAHVYVIIDMHKQAALTLISKTYAHMYTHTHTQNKAALTLHTCGNNTLQKFCSWRGTAQQLPEAW
jgi:hypothetical protein